MRQRSSIPEEQHASAERYIITYADLITLLLGLFVILYATSQVDLGKYREVAQALIYHFNPNTAPLSSEPQGRHVLPGEQGIPQPILPQSAHRSVDEWVQEMERSFKPYTESGVLTIERAAEGAVVRLAEAILFESGKSELQPQALPVLDTLARLLQYMPYLISVDGHTDSIPIRTLRYESNWHLSTARALSVAYYLIQYGVAEARLVVRGFGPQRPIAPNATPEGRARNRRVEIVLTEPQDRARPGYGYWQPGQPVLLPQQSHTATSKP
ncbi:MAG: OmpA family protein [Candidatus Kapabacteria bacterium]|nr:OmpA family protein [Candidatus Kapabacteria bacterium]MDW7997629.1 OmpA family protein [Bacteroidota bacterium]